MRSPFAPMTILGAGYVGRVLARRHPDSVCTRRSTATDLPAGLPACAWRRFDLADLGTWTDIPLAGRTVVWTFPAAPLELVQQFYKAHLAEAACLIVLGSTSAYRVEEPGALVTEDTPLDLTQPRVAGEEWLREQGAAILQLAGIFGPGREPLGWLRHGRIRNGRKLVNLIHVDDIVAAIDALATAPQPGLRINVANGEPKSWNELVAMYHQTGQLPGDFALPQADPGTDSKRIANDRLRVLLPGHAFRTPA